jgi:hypothetical protein
MMIPARRGRNALVSNPADFGSHRWPLAIVAGDDGTIDRIP